MFVDSNGPTQGWLCHAFTGIDFGTNGHTGYQARRKSRGQASPTEILGRLSRWIQSPCSTLINQVSPFHLSTNDG